MIGKDPVGSNMLRFKEQGKKGALSESAPQEIWGMLSQPPGKTDARTAEGITAGT